MGWRKVRAGPAAPCCLLSLSRSPASTHLSGQMAHLLVASQLPCVYGIMKSKQRALRSISCLELGMQHHPGMWGPRMPTDTSEQPLCPRANHSGQLSHPCVPTGLLSPHSPVICSWQHVSWELLAAWPRAGHCVLAAAACSLVAALSPPRPTVIPQ